MQIHKYKYTNTNTQMQIHKCKYTNTNTEIQIVRDHRGVSEGWSRPPTPIARRDFLSPPVSTTLPLVKLNNWKMCGNLDFLESLKAQEFKSPRVLEKPFIKVKSIGMSAIFLVTRILGVHVLSWWVGCKISPVQRQQPLRKVKQNRVERVIWELADRKQER